MLQKVGYTVETAVNGIEVLEALKKQNFDLVLMDVQMPKMNGVETTQLIRNSKDSTIQSNIPIIAVTAYAFNEDKERFLKAGMNSYITKPYSNRELLKQIKTILSLINSKKTFKMFMVRLI